MNVDEILKKLVAAYGPGTPNGLYPTETQWLSFLTTSHEGILFTSQFAKFKTDFSSQATQEAARSYSEVSNRLSGALNIEVIYEGTFGTVLYGEDKNDWDFVGMIRFPNRNIFIEFFLHPEYIAVHHARDRMMDRYKMIVSYPPFTYPAPWKTDD